MSDDGTDDTDDAFDAVLRERAAEHPDVAVFKRMSDRRREFLDHHLPPDEAVLEEQRRLIRERFGLQEGPDADRARANAIVDDLARITPDAAARGAEIDLAERAALEWLRTVTRKEPAPDVVERLHETAVWHLVGLGYGPPAVALIQDAIGGLPRGVS